MVSAQVAATRAAIAPLPPEQGGGPHFHLDSGLGEAEARFEAEFAGAAGTDPLANVSDGVDDSKSCCHGDDGTPKNIYRVKIKPCQPYDRGVARRHAVWPMGYPDQVANERLPWQ